MVPAWNTAGTLAVIPVKLLFAIHLWQYAAPMTSTWFTTRLCLFLLLVILAPPVDALDVFITRHAETMGNVTGDYSEQNQRTFSPRGLEQIATIVQKLAPYHFDHILVSPTYRTRQTILPYLREHGRKAEIWPELEECCCDSRGRVSAAAAVPVGEAITLDDEEQAYFQLRPDGRYRLNPTTEAEGLAQLQQACNRILRQFGGTTQTILLVTHSCSGSRIMELLLGVRAAGRFAPANAAISLLREEEPGQFRLILYNDAPFEQRYYWVSADGREAVPDQPYRLKLVPRFFAQQTKTGYRIEWILRNARKHVVARGEEFFSPRATGGEDGVLSIEIPTHGAHYGDTWKLDTRLVADEQVVYQWPFEIPFPVYVSLAGAWRIAEGDNPAWAKPECDDSAWGTTIVPGGWEADALPNYDGIAWYRKTFLIPPEKLALWQRRTLAVCFGAVDDADETFLNGECIGKSGLFSPEKVTAWDRPRLYEFPSELLTTTNLLAVRVSDWGGGGGIWKEPVAIGPREELERALNATSQTWP